MSTHPTPAFDPQSTTLATRAFTVQLSCALDDLTGLPAATAVHRIIPRLVLRGEIERVSAAKYLLLALLGLCDPETGTTTEALSTADLACRFGLSQDTVKRVLLDLRRIGLVASTPARGAGRDEALLCAMACLQIKRLRSFPAFLEDMCVLRGMDILILSSYDSEQIRARMQRLRQLGNSVALLVLPQEPSREAAHA